MKQRMRNSGNRTGSGRITNYPNGGFSLIEVVLSIGILMIISLPLLNYFTESVRYSSMMERRQQATFLAQEVTEGLLAENGLISDTVDGYRVAYLESWASDPADLLRRENGTAGELIYKINKDGYRVEVTIDNPDAAANVQDFLDYRIDSLTNVVHIDTTENTQAVFELLGMHYSYHSFHPEDLSWDGTVDEDWIREKMSHTMRIEVKPTDDGKYRVTIQYFYKCANVMKVDGTTPGEWKTAVLLNRTVEDLQNIYLIYNWCNDDTITITYPITAEPINMGLYVICQPDENGNPPPEDYEVVVDRSGFNGKLYGDTNLRDGQLKCDFDTPDITVSSGDAGPAVTYTIHTKVYFEEDTAGEDPLADITTKKGD